MADKETPVGRLEEGDVNSLLCATRIKPSLAVALVPGLDRHAAARLAIVAYSRRWPKRRVIADPERGLRHAATAR